MIVQFIDDSTGSCFKKVELSTPGTGEEWAQIATALPEALRNGFVTDIPHQVLKHLSADGGNQYIPPSQVRAVLDGVRSWFVEMESTVKLVLTTEVEEGIGSAECLNGEGMGVMEASSAIGLNDLLNWRPPSPEELAAIDTENERRLQAIQQLPADPLAWPQDYQRRLDEFSGSWRLWAEVQHYFARQEKPCALVIHIPA